MFARSSFRRLGAATRTYATNATQHVKPPIALTGVDGTYATALYTASKKTNSLDNVAKGVSALANLLQKDKRLEPLISSPTLSAADKMAAIETVIGVLPAAGKSEIKNFLEALAENNRLAILPAVVSKFDELVRADRGEVEVVVTSATPLDARTLGRIESAVTSSGVLEAGKKTRVVNTVQPDIKGGLIVEVADRTIDLSVSAKIAKMNKLLTDTL